jgi:RHS repeat-associated protein
MDNEIKGEGNSLNYEFRMHDPRIGRFFAVDPLTADYPHNSPYAFSENDPLNYVELEGLEKSPTKAQVQLALKVATALLSKFDSRLTAIAARGTADAITNANTIGLHDALGGDNINDYDSTDEKRAYAVGRVLGDVAAMVQGGIEVEGGLGGAAVGLAGGGVGALPGLAVAGHGALAGGTAGINLLKTSVQISSMVEPSSDSSSSSSSNSSETPNKRKATAGDKVTKSERASRRESFRQNKVRTSEANNYKVKPDPDNKLFKKISTKNVHGEDVEISHHPDGHHFKDNNTYEDPHYHGPKGGHITYPIKKK